MTLTLATFNVKDLLEPQDDGERQVLGAKLAWIAGMVRACDADVIGLQEVGTVELVRAVLERLDGHAYGEPVMGTADARGIRCALLSRVPVVEARVHTAESLPFPVFREGDPAPFGTRIPLRRGVVHARVQAPGLGLVDVLVVHFKSSRSVPARDESGRELPATNARMRSEATIRSLVWRAAEALYVRRLVDDVLAPDPGGRVAVVGDLNDVPGSPAVRAVRGEGDGELFDCAAGVDARARSKSVSSSAVVATCTTWWPARVSAAETAPTGPGAPGEPPSAGTTKSGGATTTAWRIGREAYPKRVTSGA